MYEIYAYIDPSNIPCIDPVHDSVHAVFGFDLQTCRRRRRRRRILSLKNPAWIHVESPVAFLESPVNTHQPGVTKGWYVVPK